MNTTCCQALWHILILHGLSFCMFFSQKKVRKIRMVAMWGQGSTNCGILQFRWFIRIGEHGVSLENIKNIENMENMENM